MSVLSLEPSRKPDGDGSSNLTQAATSDDTVLVSSHDLVHNNIEHRLRFVVPLVRGISMIQGMRLKLGDTYFHQDYC